MTKISAKLRATLLGGAVGLLPSMAFADYGSSGTDTATVPDHAAAEARSAGGTAAPTDERSPSVPDHATAEERGQAGTVPSGEEATERAPDHAAAERRGGPEATPNQGE